MLLCLQGNYTQHEYNILSFLFNDLFILQQCSPRPSHHPSSLPPPFPPPPSPSLPITSIMGAPVESSRRQSLPLRRSSSRLPHQQLETFTKNSYRSKSYSATSCNTYFFDKARAALTVVELICLVGRRY